MTTKSIAAAILVCTIVTPASVSAQFFGPPKFKIKHSDDRFSATPSHHVVGQYNIVSKKQVGYVIAMGDGFYLDPVVITTGNTKLLSLHVENNCTSHGNGGKWVCVGYPREVAFITGEGSPIVLPIERAKVDIGNASTNSVTRETSVTIDESGFADLSPEQYERIMNAPQLAVKLTGDDKSLIFESKVIAKEFQANLKTFHAGYIAAN